MNKITINCNAKINLALDVIRKRDDGYHDVELIFNEIPISDTVTISLRTDSNINLSCNDDSLPTDSKNIAYKAAELFFSQYDKNLGADIELIKEIPHGAGLAGGSTDAAGVLKALNSLFDNPFSNNELIEIGAKLGADVPFFISGGCAFAEGIGEILTPLPPIVGLSYVIVKPEQSISTAYVYQNLDLSNRPENLDVRAVAEGIRTGNMQMIYENSGNIMEQVTAKKVPVINEIKKQLIEYGAKISLMSGSGTTVFGVFEDKRSADLAADKMKETYKEVWSI